MGLIYLKIFQNMRMSDKRCNNNNSDNPLTSRCTDGGKNWAGGPLFAHLCLLLKMSFPAAHGK